MASRDWESAAACREIGPGPWDDDSDHRATARHICWHRCPVRQQCLEAALLEEDRDRIEHRAGIRGGLTARERLQLEQRQGAAA